MIVRHHLTSLNKIFAFIKTLVYPSSNKKGNTSFAKLQHQWSGRSKGTSLREIFLDITTYLSFYVDSTEVPLVISNNTISLFKVFRLKVAALRNLLRTKRILIEEERTKHLIQEFEDQRCANYAVDRAAFIASSLSRTKRCIVLDRAMTISKDNEPTLVTNPADVKKAAAEHFRTIAGIPPAAPPHILDMPDRWQTAYTPQDNIDSDIYQDLMAPPTDDEWNSMIQALPNNKAASNSRIPYELFKHLSAEASHYLKLLITECFNTAEIPSQWKDAFIYPIPKPRAPNE